MFVLFLALMFSHFKFSVFSYILELTIRFPDENTKMESCPSICATFAIIMCNNLNNVLTSYFKKIICQ